MSKRNRKEEITPLPPPRVSYRALMRHEDLGRAREPPERLICRERPECAGCPYPAHGFVCWTENCMRQQMTRIQRGGIHDESQNISDQPGQG